MNKLASIMGIAKKAGRIDCGADCVKEAILKKRSKLVLIASDVSRGTQEKFLRFCDLYGVSLLILKEPMSQFEYIFRKRIGVFSINDEGFAKKITEMEGVAYGKKI